jgi:capsid protein
MTVNWKFWKKPEIPQSQSKEIAIIPSDQPTRQPAINPQAMHQGNPNFQPWQGTQPAGGRTYAGLTNYAPETIIDHYAARMQARRTLSESVEAISILEAGNEYTIGKGLIVDPEPDFETIGNTPEQAQEWGKKQKNRFHLWSKSKGSDRTGTNNFYQNQILADWIVRRDGECYVRLHYSKDPNLLNPLQISFVDSNQIRGDEFTFSSGPFAQEDGIIKDDDGKPIAYKIWISDPQRPGRFKDIEVPAFDKDTGRPLMLRLFKPKTAGQTRGIPRITHAIQDFQQITGYNTAALTRMENGATFNFTSENEIQDPSDLGLSQLNRESAGLGEKTTPPVGDSEPSNVPAELTPSCSGIPEARLNETGVNVFGARQGDKLKATPDLSPGETAKEFTDSRFEKISASLGMAPEVALKKTSTSFTAAKGAFGMQDKKAAIERADLESDLTNIVYWAWTAEEIAAGRTTAPGWSDPIIREAWLQASWIAPPPIDLKPSDTANANKINAELGLIDLDKASQQLNGSSGAANRAKLAKQIPELTPLPSGEVVEPEGEDDDDTDEDNPNDKE